MPRKTKLIVTAEIVSIDEFGNRVSKSKSTTTTDYSSSLAFDIKADSKDEDSELRITNR